MSISLLPLKTSTAGTFPVVASGYAHSLIKRQIFRFVWEKKRKNNRTMVVADLRVFKLDTMTQNAIVSNLKMR